VVFNITDQDIRAKVERTVEKCLDDGWLDKNRIVKQYKGEGASQATIYRWISEFVASQTIIRAAEAEAMKLPPRFAVTKAEPPAPMSTPEPVTAELMPRWEDEIPYAGAIRLRQMVDILEGDIADLRACAAMAKRDGRILNPRLLMEAIRRCGEQWDRISRTKAIVAEAEAAERFMREIVDVVLLEPRDVSDRIFRRWREAAKGCNQADAAGGKPAVAAHLRTRQVT
jgi:hypothetical protein